MTRGTKSANHPVPAMPYAASTSIFLASRRVKSETAMRYGDAPALCRYHVMLLLFRARVYSHTIRAAMSYEQAFIDTRLTLSIRERTYVARRDVSTPYDIRTRAVVCVAPREFGIMTRAERLAF